MDIQEVKDRLDNVELAGMELALGPWTIESHSVKIVLEPTQDQIPELKLEAPLLMQKGDPANEVMKDDDKFVLVVYTDKKV